ncbi:DUF4255 domain-containing protein [uncultured Desulfobacter sp.]|uniref:DUF4255 domain-containing protein n=1 Tax=uncultured Desulfobacter sp. TaxID=240139 RepID=UPI0029F4F4B8|nr:DUF4255 domain-containing protein [uncultured Desulfobacter sp.]
MADYRAIMGVSEAIMGLLRSSYRPDLFNNELEFKVFTSKDFTKNTIANGASLFMYRVFCNGTHRLPAGRLRSDGRMDQTQLPVELHFLITIWGNDASLQNTLVGWIMRILEDTPTLPAGVLNSVIPGVFHPDETVDILLAELRTEDLFRIWDVLGLNAYQLSIPYVARIINIESIQPLPNEDHPPVQTQQINAAVFDGHAPIGSLVPEGS